MDYARFRNPRRTVVSTNAWRDRSFRCVTLSWASSSSSSTRFLVMTNTKLESQHARPKTAGSCNLLYSAHELSIVRNVAALSLDRHTAPKNSNCSWYSAGNLGRVQRCQLTVDW